MTFDEWWINIALGLECVKKMPENPVHVAYMAWKAAQPQWQPIETAPKDGTCIYVFRKHGVFPILAQYNEDFEWFEDFDRHHLYDLTHWMPLPEPPTKEI